MKQWEKVLIPYEQAVEELKIKFKAIRNQLRDAGEYSPIEFVTGRTKTISSILEKMKKYGITEDKIEGVIEDIAGIRIMCQFVDDIYKVASLIKQRDGKDLEIVSIKDYVKNPKESGYRSYHIIIRYPVQTAFGERKVLAEIQIRTLAMNVWATIEHSINYKYKGNIPKILKGRLIQSAETVYELDKEMRQIRDEVIESQKLFELEAQTVSDIIKDIQFLVCTGEKLKAARFEAIFEEICQNGNIDDLKALQEQLEVIVYRYQMIDLKS
jgi:putative GTP pyrophosphokinase